MTRLTRRGFLTAAGGCAAASLAAGRARATGPREPLTSTRLDDELLVITGGGGNIVVLSTAEGLLLVDCGLAGTQAELAKLLARELGGRQVRWLFNTHWHLEHTGANERLAAAGARIIAHENTRLWMTRPIEVGWQSRTYPPRPPPARPVTTFHYGTQELSVGGQRVQYGYLPAAHTDGDLYVYFPGHNVLAAGDAVQADGYPVIDYATGGWIGGLVDATTKLLAIGDDATRIIPGTGAPQSRDFLRAQLAMCTAVRDRIGDSVRKALDFADLEAQHPTREFDARWGDPRIFLRMAYDGARDHAREAGWMF